MDTVIFRKYAEARATREEYQKVEEGLKVMVLEEMEKNKITKTATEYGKFTIGQRVTWKYSDKVKALQEKVDLAKVKEVEKGVAQPKETHYLVYTA